MPPLHRSRSPRDPGPVHHPLFARFYARTAPALEVRSGMAAHRRELLAGLAGRVIEIGAGPGLNFPYYPDAVSEVVAVEPEQWLRRAAVEAAVRAEVPVDVVPAAAEALPVKSEAFDAAVVCLVLCSVRDVPRALGELRRVLRPGAEVRFFEHGRAEERTFAAVQRVADRILWPRLFGGCRTSRDPLRALAAAGFAVRSPRRVRVPATGLRLPSSSCVTGVAVRAD
ncbi:MULTISPECIES: class I SAM-dependent methyltransferase [Streptomyces]|uniref:class I SAM-dependent methyltransferase n=1 Tax=Streptomyces TaxID=1883 RepID=UPI00163BE462|nr:MULTISPECIES: class I SAM-dependent methyltransferase [Streptomyces]MBC2876396.1 methyltransferase domain-containing protein [Streptomyces sp. TYQ1024]UBI35388.1 class I SAM-dependent methyltransferase [Streptomyces mobaraensis]UKW27980.1 class I SAM-dependent methyltransferase [Streptomyces sp. TYQ1024]